MINEELEKEIEEIISPIGGEDDIVNNLDDDILIIDDNKQDIKPENKTIPTKEQAEKLTEQKKQASELFAEPLSGDELIPDELISNDKTIIDKIEHFLFKAEI